MRGPAHFKVKNCTYHINEKRDYGFTQYFSEASLRLADKRTKVDRHAAQVDERRGGWVERIGEREYQKHARWSVEKEDEVAREGRVRDVVVVRVAAPKRRLATIIDRHARQTCALRIFRAGR